MFSWLSHSLDIVIYLTDPIEKKKKSAIEKAKASEESGTKSLFLVQLSWLPS